MNSQMLECCEIYVILEQQQQQQQQHNQPGIHIISSKGSLFTSSLSKISKKKILPKLRLCKRGAEKDIEFAIVCILDKLIDCRSAQA